MRARDAIAQSDLKTRPSLIKRLRNRDDRDSWREFFNSYSGLIYGLAIKSGLNAEEAEDVVQETLATLWKNLDNYEYRPQDCSFKSWIFKNAKWQIVDQIRKRAKFPTASAKPNTTTDQTPTVERIPNDAPPELDQLWDEEWQQNLLNVAISRVKEKLSIREFQIFDLYVLKSWSVAEVKKMLHVSAAHIYVAKHRVSALIRKEIKKLEGEMG